MCSIIVKDRPLMDSEPEDRLETYSTNIFYHSILFPLRLFVLWNPSKPINAQRRRNVENAITPHDAKVPPPMIKAHAHALQECVCVGNGAVLASSTVACLRIRNVTTHI